MSIPNIGMQNKYITTIGQTKLLAGEIRKCPTLYPSAGKLVIGVCPLKLIRPIYEISGLFEIPWRVIGTNEPLFDNAML